MTIRNLEVGTSRSAVGSEALKQSGRRVVRHKGGRLLTGSDTKCLVALPTLPGESMEKLTIQGYACSDGIVQPDSAIHLDWVMAWYPWDFMSSITGASIDNTGLDSMVFKALGKSATDPNIVGEEVSRVDLAYSGIESIWTRESLVWAKNNVVRSDVAGLQVTESHVADRWTETIRRKLFWQQPGIIIIGAEVRPTGAQTDFGVAEIDTGLTGANWSQILTRDMGDEFVELSPQESKAYSLVYGGDTFIEADTWKEDALRCYALVQAQFRTPYPEPGKGFRES